MLPPTTVELNATSTAAIAVATALLPVMTSAPTRYLCDKESVTGDSTTSPCSSGRKSVGCFTTRRSSRFRLPSQ